MGINRMVNTSFWTDGKVDEFTPEDKYFMLYLLTNPYTTQLGIYEISIKQAAFQIGYSEETFIALIERFENKYKMIRFSKETNEIAIKNFLRHSIVKGGKPVEDCIKKEMLRVKNRSLLDYIFKYLLEREGLNKTVKKVISDYFNENDKDNDKDNDNDNERIVPRIVDESYPDSSNKHPKGEFQHVLLSDEEEDKLIERYGLEFALKAITFLDEYIEEKGYKSDSHYLTITRWVIDAVKEREEKAIKNGEVPKERYGDFDVNEAFKLALERSYGNNEDNEPGDELKQRMEALKERIGQGG
jgi:hypothetical protein